jgi:GTPase Era involved in 16S rRNA processing
VHRAPVQFRLRDQAPLRLARKLAEGPQSLPDATGAWPAPPTLLFLNKTDKIKPGVRDVALQQLHRQLAAAAPFALSLSGAAMHGEAVQQLRDHLVAAAKPGTWVLPPGVSHGASPAELAVELVRERLYRRLNQELPYRLAVSCEPPRPGPGGGLVLRVRVAVPNPRVRSIVVGRRGAIVQEYVTVPCQDALARVLGVPVRLEVTVTVDGD